MSDTFENAMPADFARSGQQLQRLNGGALTSAATRDSLPPHSSEAEKGVLGCILLSPTECLSACEERGVAPLWFYDLRNRVIQQCFDELYRGGQAIDVITVQQWLRDTDQLQHIGGVAYLAELPDAVPSAANLGYYLDILEEKFTLRQLVKTCTEAVQRAYENADVLALVVEVEREVLALSEKKSGAAEVHVKELVKENIKRLEDYHRGAAQISGLTTGLPYVDKVTGGLGGENGNFIVVAARPGMGKTSLGVDFTLHVALDSVWFSPLDLDEANKRGIDGERIRLSKDGAVAFEKHVGRPAAFFTLEMSPVRLVRRALFQRSGADLQRFRTGFALAQDFEKLHKASAQIGLGDIWIDGTKRLTIEMFKARCRRLARQRGIKMFVLDYLQLMKTDRRRYRTPDRVAEMEEISADIAALACELDVPFFILAQLNRELERAERKRRPQLSDIRNCGAVEQDADVVLMLYEPKLEGAKEEEWDAIKAARFPKDDWAQVPRRVNLLVEKNRDGTTGDCELLFHRASTHFEDFNEWKKTHGWKAPAKGERKGKQEDML